MIHRCACGVGYIELTESADSDLPQLVDGQNIRFHEGTVTCAICQGEISQIAEKK